MLDRPRSKTVEIDVPFRFLLASTQNTASEFDILGSILETQGVVLGVLIALVLMSLMCWFIVGYKWFWFSRLKKQSAEFIEVYWQAKHPNEIYEFARNNPQCPESRIFLAGYNELGRLKKGEDTGVFALAGFENLERAVHRAQAAELSTLEKWLSFLATTGSTAPFIGLFGTVWGIMRAFAGLSQVSGEVNLLTTVTPHIAEALVATAIGLLAAIPAVMAYNYFVQRVRLQLTEIEGFGSDYLNTLRRLFFSQSD